MPASGSSYRLSLGVDVRGQLLLAAVGSLGFFLAPPPVAADVGEALLLCMHYEVRVESEITDSLYSLDPRFACS